MNKTIDNKWISNKPTIYNVNAKRNIEKYISHSKIKQNRLKSPQNKKKKKVNQTKEFHTIQLLKTTIAKTEKSKTFKRRTIPNHHTFNIKKQNPTLPNVHSFLCLQNNNKSNKIQTKILCIPPK